MRVCAQCNRQVNDDKAEFCPYCGTSLPKTLKLVHKTKLPLIGSALVVLGVVTWIVTSMRFNTYDDGMVYTAGNVAEMFFFWFLAFMLASAIFLTVRSRKWYVATATLCLVLLLTESYPYWTVFGFNYSLDYYTWLNLLLTIVGSFCIIASRQEFI